MGRGTLLPLAALLATIAAAAADPLSTDASPCGGDAYSSAEVIEGRPPRRGPITAIPDTLCADVAPQHPPTPIEIYGTSGPRDGGGYDRDDRGEHGRGAPYGVRAPHGPRAPGPLRRGD